MMKTCSWSAPWRALVLASALTLGACVTPTSSSPVQLYKLVETPSFQAASLAWFEGKPVETPGANASAERLFLEGESLYWAGDVEGAFEVYAQMLRTSPEHALSRYAAARLEGMSSSVVDFEARIRPVIENLPLGKVPTLTALSLSVMGQRLGWTAWSRGRVEAPYSGDAQGLPTRWRCSPRLSTWRLLDFERAFKPESDAALTTTYRSTYIAEDDKDNFRETRPYISSSYNLTPKLGASGIYYLETFATVTGTEAQDYWVYGSFPASTKMWIDGKEVLSRKEGTYDTTKRFRRVQLSPGTHRVLLKLAYHKGYRDWFDLVFLNDRATALGGSAVAFHESLEQGKKASGTLKVLGPQRRPQELEAVAFDAKNVTSNSSMSLYLRALSSYFNRESRRFAPAAKALAKRHPKFAPIHGLLSEQVQTLWEVPSRMRNATALQELRQASKLDPESLHYTIQLGDWLKDKGKTKDIRELLEKGRDAAVVEVDGASRLRNIKPLRTWASYLARQGWDEEAERAWKATLKVAPTDCRAARSLQSLHHGRAYYPEPGTYGVSHETCPALQETWSSSQPDRDADRLVRARRTLKRYPHRSMSYVSLASELEREGQSKEAQEVLERGLEMIPWSARLKVHMAQRAYDAGDVASAIQKYEKLMGEDGYSFGRIMQVAKLREELPLLDLMQDGVKVAREIAAKDEVGQEKSPRGTADEAFYAIDFAASQYFPEGVSVTLTHTMVRVMTKGAIDRFAEVSVPGGARVLLARTVKKDGSVQVPESTAGKDTLSMPGLAEGDFVELAYLEFKGYSSALSKTHHLGMKFYFRMQQISSLRSEMVVVDPPGEFLGRNNAPEASSFTYRGKPAVRFLRKNSPRPRQEPASVGTDEFLPWVQMWRDGLAGEMTEVRRKNFHDQILDVLKVSPQVEAQFKVWKEEAKGLKGEALIKKLFYLVANHFPRPKGGFGVDVSHAVLSKEGNPMVVLHALLRSMNIDSNVYLVRSSFADPIKHPLLDVNNYNGPVLRVPVPGSPGKFVWLSPDGPDAMFNAVGEAYLGQKALCTTCAEPSIVEVSPGDSEVRRNYNTSTLRGALDAQGGLTGVLHEKFEGPRASRVRAVFRDSREETQRRKIMGSVLASHIPGGSVSGYEIEGLDNPDVPLTLKITFTRPDFARAARGGLTIEAPFFRQPMASRYARLAERTVPLMITSASRSKGVLELTLPPGMTAAVRTKSGSWELSGEFGSFSRDVEVAGNVLKITTSLDAPIQRIPLHKYAAFKKWAVGVEQSSFLAVTLR